MHGGFLLRAATRDPRLFCEQWVAEDERHACNRGFLRCYRCVELEKLQDVGQRLGKLRMRSHSYLLTRGAA